MIKAASYIIACSLVVCQASYGQTLVTNNGLSITVESGMTVTIEGGFVNQTSGTDGAIENDGDIFVEGNWTNNATGGGQVFTNANSTGTVHFTGTALQSIGGSESTTFENLTVNNSGAGLQLGHNVTALTTLTISIGNIDLNGNNLNLSTTGRISGESNANRIFGASGEILAPGRDLNLNSTLYPNIAGLGISITTGAGNTPGLTDFAVRRYAQTGGGNTSIERYVDISPTTNTTLDLTLRIEYYDNELNGQLEDDFVFWKTKDGGSTWTNEGGAVNAGSNYVEKTGINSLSGWTISNQLSSPLPIELIDFTAKFDKDQVSVEWSTAVEKDNDYFTLERAHNIDDFRELAIIEGAGDSYESNYYSYIDWIPLTGISYYRLKQTDFNGTFSYSNVISVNNSFSLASINAYPNPSFDGSMTLEMTGLEPYEEINIQLYSDLGMLTFSVHAQADGSGVYNSPINTNGKPGIYILKVTSSDQSFSRKAVFQ